MNVHSRGPGPFEAALRFAWWGRVSTEDQQDPTLSLPRQLRNSRAALPAGAAIVAHFYDVESGRRDLELRGRGSAHERSGGICQLCGCGAGPDIDFDLWRQFTVDHLIGEGQGGYPPRIRAAV